MKNGCALLADSGGDSALDLLSALCTVWLKHNMAWLALAGVTDLEEGIGTERAAACGASEREKRKSGGSYHLLQMKCSGWKERFENTIISPVMSLLHSWQTPASEYTCKQSDEMKSAPFFAGAVLFTVAGAVAGFLGEGADG